MRNTTAVLIATLAVVVLCSGCPHNNPKGGSDHGFTHYPHNLAHLHCGNNHHGESHPVEVVPHAQVLKDLDNLVIFVSEQDSPDWFTQDATNTVKVTFTDTFAGELFENGQTHFEFKGGSPRSDTDKPKVKKQGQHERQAYKYTIEIDDKDGNCLAKLDPHVIPMGK
jgi:hypothetical protein